jgi:hypothetical protein
VHQKIGQSGGIQDLHFLTLRYWTQLLKDLYLIVFILELHL